MNKMMETGYALASISFDTNLESSTCQSLAFASSSAISYTELSLLS